MSSAPPMTFTYHEGDKVPKDVTDVIVDPSVKLIGKEAFYECESLKSIKLPDSIAEIGNGAFHKCSSLTSIKLPESIMKIGEHAFHGCSSLTSIKLPDSISEIGAIAFYKCSSLASIKLPDSITEVGPYAFLGCSSLTSIELPDSITNVFEAAFFGCSSLTSIKFPDSITEIGNCAFYSCSSLTSIELPDSNVEIGIAAFHGCSSLASIQLPDSITEIGKDTFYGCSSLTSVKLPDSITGIGSGAFCGCSSLTSIELPDSISPAEIGENAFNKCTSLPLRGMTFKNRFMKLPLHRICYQHDITSKEIKDCVERNPDFSTLKDCLQMTALHLLLLNPKLSLDLADPLLREGSCIALRESDHNGNCPLHVACSNPLVSKNMIEKLLQIRPDTASEKNYQGRYPLHCACSNPSMTRDVIEVLVHRAPHAAACYDVAFNLPFHLALKNKLTMDIQSYLFSIHPVGASQVDTEYRGDFSWKSFFTIGSLIRDSDHRGDLSWISCMYFSQLLADRPSSIREFSSSKQHGWVQFVSTPEILKYVEENHYIKHHSFDGPDEPYEPGLVFNEYIKNDRTGSNKIWEVMDVPQPCTKDIAEILAFSKDFNGRSAIDYAVPAIKSALQERLLFLGRYELVTETPIHKSATCVVVKAYDYKAEADYRAQFNTFANQKEYITKDDFRQNILEKMGLGMTEELFDEKFSKWDTNKDEIISENEFVDFCKLELDKGRRREVAFKFMKNKDQFQRELEFRKKKKLNSKFVVGVLCHFDADEDSNFKSAIESEGFSDYKFAIVMPHADRNLDTVFRSERPDENKVRTIMQEIGEAIQHLHENGIIHGDLKLLNVVRIDSRFRLIDLDACSKMSDEAKFFVGCKFSSGVLPPEMVKRLTESEYNKFLSYFKETKDNDSDLWQKIKPRVLDLEGNQVYAIKTYKEKMERTVRYGQEVVVVKPVDPSSLPYDLVEATEAVDMWSFGTILFTLLAESSLFKVNRDDDLENASAMKELHDWNDTTKLEKLKVIQDPFARKLLGKLLSRDPMKRGTMKEVLDDDFFKVKTNSDWEEAKHMLEKIDKMQEKQNEYFQKILKNTIILISMSEELKTKIENSTSVVCNAVFEATEVLTPTCFVILPYPRPDDAKADLEVAMTYMDGVLNHAKEFCSDPKGFARGLLDSFLEKKLFMKTMYLYLVDESTGEKVHDDDIYPIKINVKTDKLKEFLPVMLYGIQAMGMVNSALGLASMFYPVLPNKVIPNQVLDKAKAWAEDTPPQVIEDALKTDNAEPKRGKELREFEEFLKVHDPGRTYSNLRRVCDKASGNAIWVTDESAERIANESFINDVARKKVEELKKELKAAEEAQATAEKAQEKAEEAQATAEAELKKHLEAVNTHVPAESERLEQQRSKTCCTIS